MGEKVDDGPDADDRTPAGEAADLRASEEDLSRLGLAPPVPHHLPFAVTHPEGPMSGTGAGASLGGRFQLCRLLGAGGFGAVYEAHDHERDARVALKCLTRVDAGALYRFKREFRSLADLTHDHLVSLHELHCTDGQWYFTMDLIDGVDFLRHVRPAGLDEGRLRAALGQLVRGVDRLHGAGKLHRDLKPSNVLVTEAGRVVVLDFGLVGELFPEEAHKSADLGIAGTPAYMAPEHCAGLPLGPAADFYAVGVMLYEALTGALPFTPYLGTTAHALSARMERDAPDPRAAAGALPADLCELCARLLHRDPAARAGAQEVLRVLGAGAAQAGPRPETGPPFVGREDALLALHAAYRDARGGGPVVVLIHGPSGIGKSALVRRFLGPLAGEGAVVLSGRCYERESVPYNAIDSLVDALTQHLLRLPPAAVEGLLPRDVLAVALLFPVLLRAVGGAPRRAVDVADPHELRRRAFAALRELLARIADHHPLVVALDDLQWGDADSAALLRDVFSSPDAPALLLLCCFRSEDGPPSAPVQVLRAAGGAREVALRPLAEPEAERLARALLGPAGLPAETDARAIARESGGSPFFVSELVQHQRGGPGPAAGEPPGSAVTLSAVLEGRIRRLPAAPRLLLQAVAVAERPIAQGVAQQAARLGGAEAQAAVAALCSGRLLRRLGARAEDTVETYHDRVRQSALSALPAEVERELHGRLARALIHAGQGDPETLARHFSAAGEAAQAAEYAEQAGERAARALAFDRAVALFRLALGCAPAERAQPLREKLAEALVHTGRRAEAAQAYLGAVPEAAPERARDLRRLAAEQLLRAGHLDEGLSALGAVLGAVGMDLPGDPTRALLSLLRHRAQLRLRGLGWRERRAEEVPPAELARIDVCWSVGVGLGVVDPIRSADFHARHLLLALRAGEPERIMKALLAEVTMALSEAGRAPARTARLVRLAEDLARRLHPAEAQLITAMVGAIGLHCEGRWQEARPLFARTIALGREQAVPGADQFLEVAETSWLHALLQLGDFPELGRQAELSLQAATARGDLYALTNLRTLIVPYTLLAAGRPDEALRVSREAIRRWSTVGWHLQHYYGMTSQADAHLYKGEGEAAWRCVRQGWPALRRSQLLRVQVLRVYARYLRAKAALGAGETARVRWPLLRAVEHEADALRGETGIAGSAALARVLLGGVAALRGASDLAAGHFGAAAETFQALGMAVHAAAADRRRGELLGGAEGAALASEADARLDRQGCSDPRAMTAMVAPGV